MILIFSKKTIEKRIEHIVSNYSSVNNYLIVPLIVALMYVIILPYFMWAVDELVRKSTIGRKKNVLKQIIFDFEGKQEIAIEESKLEDLKASYRDKADFNNQLEQLRTQIDEREESLKKQIEQIDNLKQENNSLKDLVSDYNSDNSKNQSAVYDGLYEEFKKTDMYDYFRDVGVKIRNERIFPYGINEIIKEKFLFQGIVEEVTNESEFYYRFTSKGIYFWRKYVNNIRVSKNIKPSNNIDDDLPF